MQNYLFTVGDGALDVPKTFSITVGDGLDRSAPRLRITGTVKTVPYTQKI